MQHINAPHTPQHRYEEPTESFGDIYADRAATVDLPDGTTEKAMAFYRESATPELLPVERDYVREEVRIAQWTWALTRRYHLLGRVAFPAAAGMGHHMLTGMPLLSGIAAGLTYGGAASLRRLKKSGWITVDSQPKDQDSDPAPDEPETFKVPYHGIANILGGKARDHLLERQYDVNYDSLTVPGRSVLEWLEHRYKNRIPLWFDSTGATKPMSGSGTVVRTDTSLFRLYVETMDDDGRQSDIDPDQRRYYAGIFAKIRDKIASDYALELQPAPMPDVEDWKDIPCSYIAMFPTDHLQSMLREAADPADLWYEITPSLREYEGIRAETLIHGRRTHQLNEIGKLTEVPSSEHDAELAELQTQMNKLHYAELDVHIAMSAIGMVHLRKQAIGKFTQEMLDAMEESHGGAVMHDVLDLYDIASTAFAVHANGVGRVIGLDPDIFRPYLTRAAELADGTAESFRRLYTGMQYRFPELQLPDTPPLRRQRIGYAAPDPA